MAKAKHSKKSKVHSAPRSRDLFDMKVLLEIVLALVLYPVALVLMWVDLVHRKDMQGFVKLIWALVGLVWGFGPILYVLVAKGKFW